jgi:hypothetical protein
VHRVLSGDDLFWGHSGEPIITGVEIAHVIKAEPAVVTGAIKSRAAFTGCAEFAGFTAPRRHAAALRILYPAMKTIVLHRFHMAIVRVEGKP